MNQIDTSDIQQLDKASQGIGPRERSNNARGSQFDQAHEKGTSAENKVNRNTRV